MSAVQAVKALIGKLSKSLDANRLEAYRQDFEDEHQSLRLERTKDGLYADASVQAEWIKWAEHQHFLDMQW
ncbi:hypothetical protein [Pseudomonas marginalis]|uniref:hypothetical protein n=1 Tax=Pseudomonas marginalis TaxID=298 RepID=UPI002A365BBF|nr:hypothetical protein [Pseudomonas marginalis]WPN21788.1 hypothetical protein QMK57_20540 [Pseudomonas marginalis]